MTSGPRDQGRVGRIVETLFTILLPVFAIWFMWQATKVPEPPRNIVVGPQTFPILAGLLMLVVSVPLLLQRFRLHRRISRQSEEADEQPLVPGEDEEVEISDWMAVVVVLLAVLMLFLVLEILGFVVALSLFLFGLSTFFAPRSWVRNLVVSVLFAVTFYSLFTYALRIALPNGILAPIF